MNCKAKAEWKIHSSGACPLSYSCGKHLPKMVSDATIVVVPCRGYTTCCYVEEESKP